MKLQIAPSLLAANFYNLKTQLESVMNAGASVLHVDVMDGIFVPNISIGVPVVENLSQTCGMTLDVHLMITEPKRYIKRFAEAGANWLTVHYEAIPREDLGGVLSDIRALGCKAGLSIKPDTSVSVLEDYAAQCDLILIMTVPPGFGGQLYDPNGNARVAEARGIINAKNPDCMLSVDGGVDVDTARGAYKAGVNLLVSGSAVFGKPDAGKAVKELLEICEGG